MRSRASSASTRAISEPVEVDFIDDNGAVLKQLLLTGKGEVRKDYSNRNSYYPTPLFNRTSPSIQSSANQLRIHRSKPNEIPDRALRQELGVHAAHPNHHSWMRETERWSPPILTPPSDGRAYSPPSTPVAHIEPYVEPKVMYNPYFLWQLYSYKQSCNNGYYSFPQYNQIC